MNRARYFVLFAALLLCAGMAQANPINDPVIIVRGGSGSVSITSSPVFLTYPNNPGCTSGPYPSDPFPTYVPSSLTGLPSMTCVFNNLTGAPIFSLTFNITSAQLPLTLQCALLCSAFTQTPTGAVATFFFNGNPIPFSPQLNHEFAIDFIGFDVNNTSVTLAVNAVPEPGSLALLGTGLLAIAARVRRKKKV